MLIVGTGDIVAPFPAAHGVGGDQGTIGIILHTQGIQAVGHVLQAPAAQCAFALQVRIGLLVFLWLLLAHSHLTAKLLCGGVVELALSQ
ncbi:MAG: hypothetical protein JO202_17475 [Ktedonobacteraceae bacterium]|nr:hypothetical protein [Ktedonobacteraceae bacterium]